MKNILEACKPRPEILSGQFNPEIFKASLSRVLEDYGKGTAGPGADSLYSDPEVFYRDATFATQGIKDTLQRTFSRLVAGELSSSGLQRLDTAFGGGKSHTLIALTHAALQGKRIAEYVENIVPSELLPEPDAIRVVGVIGDTVDTLREERDEQGNPRPNTLWWLIAQQTLPNEAQKSIRARLENPSAPASDEFFEALFGDQPTLIIIDEIAQYLSRMEAAFPGLGAEQSAAFLMSLATYAEDRPHLSVVISLASASNAFGDYNTLVRTLQTKHSMSRTDAESVVEGAQESVRSVINRSADATTPVQQGDLSKIMAKRLFVSVDRSAAEAVAEEFIQTYRNAGVDLSAGANDPELRDHLIDHYPFHPTLISYLSEDLAQVESFQGTRGLLRTLARAVRRIWEAKLKIPMIQIGHLDLSDSYIRSELLGATGNTDLAAVLDSDVTKSSDSATVGATTAQALDQANPHPDGLPVHEWSWRVVFLESLIGRAAGLQDEKFGVDMAAAVYAMASPAIKPAAVHSALEQIAMEANYLRERDGRLYADTAPTLNNILRRIEQGVSEAEAVDRVEEVVRDLIHTDLFEVYRNITDSEQIPDKGIKPQLGVFSFTVDEFEPDEFVERRGNAPRSRQNLIFLLAPGTAHPKGWTWEEQRTQESRRQRESILNLARKALAVEKLKANPEAWSVSHDQLQKGEFRETRNKIPQELSIAVQESYRYLLFPSKDGGRVVIRDLGKRGSGPTAGGSSGLLLEDSIRRQLSDDGELITAEQASSTETLLTLGKLFFSQRNQVWCDQITRSFTEMRPWPILERPDLLGDILRQGAAKGQWCLGEMPDRNAHKPENLYHKENPPPIQIEPTGEDWMLCTREHAKRLGWMEEIVRDPDQISSWLLGVATAREQATVEDLRQAIEAEHDKIDPQVFNEQVTNLLLASKIVAFPEDGFDENGRPDPEQATYGDRMPLGGIHDKKLKLVPMQIAREREWVVPPTVEQKVFSFSQSEAIRQLLNLFSGRSLDGSTTEVSSILVYGTFKSDQSRFSLTLAQTAAGSLASARDLFAAIATRVDFSGDRDRLDITIGKHANDCRLVGALEVLKKTSQE